MSAVDVRGHQRGDTGYALDGQHNDRVLGSPDGHTTLGFRRGDVSTLVVIESFM